MSIPHPTGFQSDKPDAPAQDRGLFDCFGKKEAKEDDVPMTEAEHKPTLMEKLHRSGSSSSSSSSEEEVEEGGVKIRRRKKKGLTDKIKAKLPGHKNEGPEPFAEGDHNHQQAPEGMLPSDEKKGFVEKIKDKISGDHKDETAFGEGDYKHKHAADGMHASDENKGFLEKIKDKMPSNHKDETVITPTPPPAYTAAQAPAPVPQHCQPGGHCGGEHGSTESPEKKGIFDKIKDMLPGGHKDGDEAKKDY